MRALALALIGSLAGSGCAVFSPPDQLHAETPTLRHHAVAAGVLEAGAAVEDVSPGDSVYMAGFGFNKSSEGLHDPITVRALALRRGSFTGVILSADLIGLHHHQVEYLRERVRELVSPDAFLVAATHNHAGPDTLGMWGFPPLVSGIDAEYRQQLLEGIERCVRRAVSRLAPVRLRWGEVEAPAEGISRNKRDPELIDRRVSVIAFDRPQGTPVATLVHFACHPEILGSKNRLLSADFPGPLYRVVETARPGSVTLYLNGSLGGMVTAAQRTRSFAEVERIGGAIARLALKGLADAKVQPRQISFACARQPMAVPIQNRSLHLGQFFGIFDDRPFFDGGYTRSEVQGIRLGSLVLLTVPGEILPRFGAELDALIDAPLGLIVGLGNDELGYLIHEEDWDEERYEYERDVSPGPLATTLIRSSAREVLRQLEALHQVEHD